MPSSSILRAGRVAGIVIATLVAVGSAPAAPPVAQAASCPSLPVSVEDLVALQRQDGPLAKAFSLGVTPMNERALACFGSREITLSAFVNRPDGLGGTSSFAITPSWIVGGGLIVFGSSREVSPGFGDGPFFFVSTRPSAGDLQHQYARRWVTIRGHFDDPAAATCRATGPAGVTPSRTQAVEICRTMFVLTSIRTPAAPDTATSPPSTARSTPSLSPALWLGGLVGALVAAAVIRRSDTDRRSRRGSR